MYTDPLQFVVGDLFYANIFSMAFEGEMITRLCLIKNIHFKTCNYHAIFGRYLQMFTLNV